MGTWHSPLAALIGIVFAVSSAGCLGPYRDWTDDLVWSPDGRRAAYLHGGTLFLIDAKGRPTQPLVTNAYRVAWAGDSEHLIVARTRTVDSFAEIAAAAGPDRARQLATEAEHLWQHALHAEWPDDAFTSATSIDAATIYLREHHAEAMRELLGDEYQSVSSVHATLHAMMVARVVGDRLEPGPLLDEFVLPIKSIRPSDDGRFVAFVTKNEEFMMDDTVRMFVVPANTSSPVVLVAEGTNESPDWTPDGRDLLYFQGVGEEVNLGTLGCLTRQALVAPDGAFDARPEAGRCLINVVFEAEQRVRCLSDGRVLFNAFEIGFPRPTATGSRVERLFMFDPAVTGGALRPLLPNALDEPFGVYELNANRTEILYGTALGDIRRIRSADCAVEPRGLATRLGVSSRT